MKTQKFKIIFFVVLMFILLYPSSTEKAEAVIRISNLQKGLVGHWELDKNSLKSSNVLADKTPYGNNGTFNNTPVFTTDRHNQTNKAMTFNGTTDYVNIPHNTGLNPSATTISVWIKSNELITGSMERSFIRKQKQVETGNALEWYHGTIQFWAGTGTVQYTMDLSAGTWYYLVGTWDGGTALKLYVNGVQVSTGTGGSQLSNTTPITISGYDNTGDNVPDVRKFNGSISDVRIYNRALSAAEVRQLYKSY